MDWNLDLDYDWNIIDYDWNLNDTDWNIDTDW